jgi:hypothetical protein
MAEMAHALADDGEVATEFPEAWANVMRQADLIRDATNGHLIFVCAAILDDGYLHVSFAHDLKFVGRVEMPRLMTLKSPLGRIN